MNICRLLGILFLCIHGYSSIAQLYSITGKITDQSTQDIIIGAVVYLKHQNTGTTSDVNGNFKISTTASTDTIIVRYTGYQSYQQTLTINKNIHLNIALQLDSLNKTTVIISENPYTQKIEATQMSKVELTPEEALLIPSLGGEIDMLKILQLKPGIKNGGEGSSGLYVRGGGPDQNLFLMNGAQVYNPSHLFGFFSIFNTDAVKSIELYKGDFPARYGGRLSSVVDVNMRSGDTTFHARGGIGLISSRLTLEGPFANKKGTWIISGRRTYFDIFTRQINQSKANDPEYNPIPDYHFWDLNGNIQFQWDKKNNISYSGYYGNDKFKFNDDNFKFKFNWGNFVNTLKWEHQINSNWKLSNSLIYSRYKYDISNRFSDFNLNLQSKISDWSLVQEWTYKPDSNHTIQAGWNYTYHSFLVSRLRAASDDGKVQFGSGNTLHGQEIGIYITDQFNISPKWRTQVGIRYSGFYNEKYYSGLEPRASIRYKISNKQSLKLSYAKMYQYLHLASNTGASLPTDIWYPSTDVVRPQQSQQIAIGHEIILPGNKFYITNEFYYKGLKNIIDFKDGAQLYVNDNLENEFVFGKGRSFGWEIYIEKKVGKTTGWIGYTLSKTERRFDSINSGAYFPARYDRRHDISIVLIHQLSKRVSLSATWVYGTGNAISLPIGRYIIQDVYSSKPIVIPIYTERNGYRMAPYHRMDLGLVWKLNPKWGYADLTFSIYNVYNRLNPYFIYFDEVKDANDITIKYQAKQVSLFPTIPSITFNFKW
ncbi:MAG: TonB-dependent receptor [Cytophagaceae bacterium]